ncbi:MAG: hypothetical protein EH225_08015 [Calditrichaeota bacterium]|nr:hypothetical protein [Calditrichota bacterium]RQW02785.1 MAG: hypothetical protein EH225_08015 [Calditrichota bacterium]
MNRFSRIAVLINQTSGTIKELGDDPERIITSAFQREGFDTMSMTIEAVPGSEIESAARKLLREEPELIVAGGGDGTVNLVVNLIHHTDTVLGILPLGTFNHFAQDSGIPQDLGKAIRNLVKGVIKSVDVAEVNGHIFVNNSSVGIYPLSVTERKYQQKKLNIGKNLAMALAILKTTFWFPRYSVTAESADIAKTITSPAIFIGNNRYQLSPFKIGKRESVSEGILCGYAFECTHHLCPLHFLFLLMFNQLRFSDKFIDFYFNEVKIYSAKKHLKVSIDGEVIKLKTPLHYRSHPKTLQIIRSSDERDK